MPPRKRKPQDEQEPKKSRVADVLIILGCLIVVVYALAYVTPKPTTDSMQYGVKVVSEIPLERLQWMDYIALYNTTNSPAELTCKFELSAISKPDPRGYRISIEDGDYGLFLKEKTATIKGRNEEEVLTACHVFACLRDGIECPNFVVLEKLLREAPSMSVILDSNVGITGGRGYAEIMAALSYLQSKHADLNGDGNLTQSEVDANNYFIYPFIKEGDVCRAQSFNTVIQNWSGQNATVNCSAVNPAIELTYSNVSAIRVDGGKVIISGSDDDVHTGSIIVRDTIAPEWIRRLYGFN